MKCVITYLQNKRVALPYIFGKYCYPEMKKVFPELKLFHIFHDFHATDKRLTSTRSLSEKNLVRVKKFIGFKKYPAEIITHSEINPELYFLPSVCLSIEIALREQADFHLWLEDDAIVFDLDFRRWQSIIDVGLYRDTMKTPMVNSAFLVASNKYNEKVLPELKTFRKDGKSYKDSSQLENLLASHVNDYVLLNRDNAIRHHPYKPIITKQDVRKWLKRKIPHILSRDLDLLDLDFKQ